eukprot:CAMPEP_0202862290 /NCGR_PEP_ID=MMETSP1391-20130828/3384_1 /ASSEMBLY_ACC=CAM_ASM_000867 /TAXON_ID=1034604 /ORGANISM="Chlamydomonas leiostraca, Strain SAG 11-49" /LENGTH=173 /DNA_ID=CAMNT_0049541805 /DNA_START=55 /DNA_END=573 /DNA_ORIENTATION=+
MRALLPVAGPRGWVLPSGSAALAASVQAQLPSPGRRIRSHCAARAVPRSVVAPASAAHCTASTAYIAEQTSSHTAAAAAPLHSASLRLATPSTPPPAIPRSARSAAVVCASGSNRIDARTSLSTHTLICDTTSSSSSHSQRPPSQQQRRVMSQSSSSQQPGDGPSTSGQGEGE